MPRAQKSQDSEGSPRKRKREEPEPETIDLTNSENMDRKKSSSRTSYAQPSSERPAGARYKSRDGRSSTSSGSSSGRTPDGQGARASSSRHHYHSRPEGSERQHQQPQQEAPGMRDFYTVLEVSRTSTQADIKKAYRRLALKWHPDKNPDNQEEATVRFKEISEAYEVLVDDNKRRSYDQYGKEGLNGNMGGGSRSRARQDPFAGFFEDPFSDHFFTFRDPEDVFREFFKDDPFEDVFGSFFGGGMFGGPRRSRGNQVAQPSIFSPFGFGLSPFGNMGMGMGMGMGMSMNSFDMLESGGGGGFFSSTTFGGSSGARQSSTSTRLVGNKKIVTQKLVENGIETVTVSENGVLKSKTVNGVPQALGY